MLRAADIHALIGAMWPEIHAQLGVAAEFLRMRGKRGIPGPCLFCGGRDRYLYDNKYLRGDWFCRHCGHGDGFELLTRVHGWSFSEARRRVLEAAGVASAFPPVTYVPREPTLTPDAIATPTRRVTDLLKTTSEPDGVPDIIHYLTSRKLWPLPRGCGLRGHPSVEYWHDGQRVGRFAALVGKVQDIEGELVTAHVTHLQNGKKLASYEPRKILSPMTGRRGCAVRLMPAATVIGISEGVETALSAHRMHKVPVWAALNTSLLAKFEPPKSVEKLVVFADSDAAGLEAAARVMERLQGRLAVELQLPPPGYLDFNEALLAGVSS